MTRFSSIGVWAFTVTAIVGMAAESLATPQHAPMTSARAYFIRAYALVIAGETLAPQCDLLQAWQTQNLRRHANSLRALMAQRLPVEDINQAKRIASELVDRHSSCDTSARAIVDDSLFAAHALVHSRAEGTEPQSIDPEMKEFLAWARTEIEAAKHKQVVNIVTAPKRKNPTPRPTAGFNRFKTIVTAYYLERRCKHLGRKAAKSYWKAVTRAHKKAVAKFGADEVGALQKNAERTAKRKAHRCGQSTRKQVVAGYALTRPKPQARSFRASLTVKRRSHEAFLGR